MAFTPEALWRFFKNHHLRRKFASEYFHLPLRTGLSRWGSSLRAASQPLQASGIAEIAQKNSHMFAFCYRSSSQFKPGL